MKYKINVIEIRNVPVTYVVEADSEEEAFELAEAGDTIEETEYPLRTEVDDRFVCLDSLELLEP